MRQRGMGAVKAIVAMVIAGLIVSGIIFYGPDIWRKIQEGTSRDGSSGVLSPIEVREHPEQYIGETVTVEGWYYSDVGISPLKATEISTQEEALQVLYGSLPVDLPEDAEVYSGAKYRFAGVVIQVEDVLGNLMVKLDATSVQSV